MANHYKIYLNDVLIPVNPTKMTVKYSNKNQTMQLIDGMEINILKQPGLSEITMDIMIPAVPYAFAVYENGFLPVAYFMQRFKDIKQTNKPIFFKMHRRLPDGTRTFDTESFKCTLENYQFVEDAKEGFDVVFSMSFKAYNDYGTKKYVPTASAPEGTTGQAVAQRPSDKTVPDENNKENYTVRAGDTLWAICKSKYGDGGKYREIAKNNGISNPNYIQVGQVIVLD